MLSIEREYNKFQIKISGDRKKYYARSAIEILNAVEHYFVGHSSTIETCPFCKEYKRESAKF